MRIFIAIKQRSKDICKFGAYTASGIKSSGPQSRGSIVNQLERHGAFWQDFILLQLFPIFISIFLVESSSDMFNF